MYLTSHWTFHQYKSGATAMFFIGLMRLYCFYSTIYREEILFFKININSFVMVGCVVSKAMAWAIYCFIRYITALFANDAMYLLCGGRYKVTIQRSRPWDRLHCRWLLRGKPILTKKKCFSWKYLYNNGSVVCLHGVPTTSWTRNEKQNIKNL